MSDTPVTTAAKEPASATIPADSTAKEPATSAKEPADATENNSLLRRFWNMLTLKPSTAPSTAEGLKTKGGTRRRRKKSNKTKGKINFSKIKWGSFTKVYNRYIKKRPYMKSKIPTLKQFAHYVNKNSKMFNKKTHKKALFYTNIIEKK